MRSLPAYNLGSVDSHAHEDCANRKVLLTFNPCHDGEW